MAMFGELTRPDRGERDAVLVGLGLGGDAHLHAVTSSATRVSKVVPRSSSCSNISGGSMQRSGGSAPRARIEPRASRRTAAAAGAAVETTPPPIPHADD